jgi:nicotinamidase-related amidase
MSNDFTLPDRNHCVLLTIDVQRDTTLKYAPLEIEGTLEAVPFIQKLVQAFRNNQSPIIHVVRLYRQDSSNVDLCRRFNVENGSQMVAPGSNGSELMKELKPNYRIKLDSDLLLSGQLQKIGNLEWIMCKPRWGAFYNTPLEKHLRLIDTNTVVICGCNFPNCPRTTVYEASERDFRIVYVKDATSAN